MLKLNAPAEIHWCRSNMNKRDPILMKTVEVLKDCRRLNASDEMNCPMPRSVEKVPVRNEKSVLGGYRYVTVWVSRFDLFPLLKTWSGPSNRSRGRLAGRVVNHPRFSYRAESDCTPLFLWSFITPLHQHCYSVSFTSTTTTITHFESQNTSSPHTAHQTATPRPSHSRSPSTSSSARDAARRHRTPVSWPVLNADWPNPSRAPSLPRAVARLGSLSREVVKRGGGSGRGLDSQGCRLTKIIGRAHWLRVRPTLDATLLLFERVSEKLFSNLGFLPTFFFS